MKKGNFLRSAFVLFSLSGLLACDKKDEKKPEPEIKNTEITKGLPEERKKLNGFVYAGNSWSNSNGSTYPQGVRVSAFFGDPSRDLLSGFNHQTEQQVFTGSNISANVSVGNLFLNGSMINNGSFQTVNYNQSLNSYMVSQDAHWTSDGNKSFLPMDVTVPGGFPVINPASLNSYSVISKSKDMVLSFSGFISQCDSVSVTFGYSPSDFQYKRKCVPYSDGGIRFTKSELSYLYSNYNIDVQFTGFSYWNKTTNNKNFVFELSSRVHLNSQIID